MNRLVTAMMLLLASLVSATCERSEMFNLSMYGFAPRQAIFLYQIGLSSGEAKSDNDANSNCYTMGLQYLSLVHATTVKAFRSFEAMEEIRFQVPSRYWSYPVMGISPALAITTISNSWAGLWDGSLENPINTSLEMTDASYWWSGSNADGSASENNCGGWHEGNADQQGQAGGAGISEITATCDNSFYIVCLAY